MSIISELSSTVGNNKKAKKTMMPKRIYNTYESVERFLQYLQKQMDYKPKMSEIPGFKEKYEKEFNHYQSIDDDILDIDLLKETDTAMRNHTFNEYRLLNPKPYTQIREELIVLGCINQNGETDSTLLHEFMHYFMLENLSGYFADNNKRCFDM